MVSVAVWPQWAVVGFYQTVVPKDANVCLHKAGLMCDMNAWQ